MEFFYFIFARSLKELMCAESYENALAISENPAREREREKNQSISTSADG
jgi:hypothetical protein